MSDVNMMFCIYIAGLVLCCFYSVLSDDRDHNFLVPYLIGILATILIMYFERGG